MLNNSKLKSKLKITKTVSGYILAAFLSLFISHACYALSPAGFQVALYAGDSQPKAHTSALVFLGDETDTLIDKSGGDNFTPGIGIGENFDFGSTIKNLTHSVLSGFLLGVNLFYLKNSRHGEVLQFGLPEFYNFNYFLKLHTKRIMLNGQLYFHPLCHTFTPFLAASVGYARIRSNYREIPLLSDGDGDGGGQLNLGSASQTNLVYSLGAGVKVAFVHHVLISLSYLYTNFGAIHTAVQSNDIVLAHPITIHFHTHTY